MAHSNDAQQNLWTTQVCSDRHFQFSLSFVPALALLFLILNSPWLNDNFRGYFLKLCC